MPASSKLAVIFHGGGGNVYVNPADGAVFMFDGVDGVDAFQNVIYGIVDRDPRRLPVARRL